MLKPSLTFWRRLPAPASWRLASSAAAVAALLWGCGGCVGSGGTGGFASGPITGFGSVIVDEVRFEDSSADITDTDGVRRSRDDLRLGMAVEVESGPSRPTPIA